MRLLKDQDLSNKNVVVRLDLNVPIQDKQIIDSVSYTHLRAHET